MSTHASIAPLPWGSDASVFWRQQLFAIHGHFFRCPCCDTYLERLWQEQDIAFHAHYCAHCTGIIFVSHSLSDWLWSRHDDSRFAVWFSVPCPGPSHCVTPGRDLTSLATIIVSDFRMNWLAPRRTDYP